MPKVSPAPSTQDAHTAKAAPTKLLLVDVLTKDIDLVAAIIDLVDNSVDSARSLRDDEELTDLEITLKLGERSFQIVDNCRGISLKDAEERAFRFGPDPDDPPDPFSTGQFGVGMKRALFKLGTGFDIKSRSDHESFRLKVNVAKWLDAPDWTFPLTEVVTDLRPSGESGTNILIEPLRDGIAQELARPTVVNELKEQLADRHQRSIVRGLKIKVDRTTLRAEPPKVVCSSKIKPVIARTSLNGSGDAISVGIVAGVFPGKPRDAGWSVFLNDRAVLLADKGNATGWGEDDEKRIPRFHNQYGRFRGFVFLSCEDTTRLPWNTTKTGLDGDDAIYRQVRAMMVDAADPVIDFLDDVKKEKPEDDAYGELRRSIEEGETESVYSLVERRSQKWRAPAATFVPPEPPDTTRVYTDQPIELVEDVKEELEIGSNKELGDFIWDYFVDREMR